jgi:hypothetical protein
MAAAVGRCRLREIRRPSTFTGSRNSSPAAAAATKRAIETVAADIEDAAAGKSWRKAVLE